MSREESEDKFGPEAIVFGHDTAVRTLCEHAFMSILKDYTEAIPDGMDGLLRQVEALGFGMHDLTRGSGLEDRGTLLYRIAEDELVPIAFIGLVRSMESGGVTVEINRLDKDRTDTLELREVTTWN